MQEADGSNPLFSTVRIRYSPPTAIFIAGRSLTFWHKQSKHSFRIHVREVQNKEKESKGAWWMPRLTEAKKDVVSCEKPRVGANGL